MEASRRIFGRRGVSAAHKAVAVNRRSRKRVFTEANEGNEDGEKGVRSGLSQSRRALFKGDAAPDAFTFVVFVSFCVKSLVGAQFLSVVLSVVAFCFIYSSIQTRS
jgi:hypothetical protein